MKNILLITAIILTSLSYAQVSTKSTPISSIALNLSTEVPVLELTQPDMRKIKLQNELDSKNGEFYKNGVSVLCDIDTENSGVWETLEDGSRLWRLSITIDGALALGLYYDAFWIPSNGELFVYNEDKTQVIGGFTNANNHESGVFANELIIGNFLTLEYHQKGESKPIIHINEINYCYRGIKGLNQARDFEDSDDCEVNTSCSEGDEWRDIIKSACRINIKTGNSFGWCSGAAINNTENDCTPYVLTADHCGGGNSGYASASDMNQWVFYFNYESDNCENPNSNPSSNTVTGCSLVSNSGNININGTSDFHLVELSSFPFDYGIFAAGWDVSGDGDSEGVSIHHPSGDIKKISTYATNLSTTGWIGGGVTHWRVRWTETENGHGVTEGGSSGSPIFNSEGRIIGDLSGGGSYCTNTNAQDLYGKLSYSWESNGNSNNRKLKPFLDPTNSGVETLDGLLCGTNLFSNFYTIDNEIPTNAPINFYYTGTGNPVSYAWTFFGGAANVSLSTSSDAEPTVEYYSEGSYTVKLKVTDAEGQESTETKQNYVIVDDNFTSINKVEKLDVQVFPNPSTGTVYISQSANIESTLRVYNLLGENMMLMGFTTETKQISLNHLQDGVYFIEVSSSKGKKVEQIILNR